MRFAFNRLIVAAAGALVVLACDNPPMGTKFGNGISGGPTGTNPIQPTNPNSPDTTKPFAIIDTPATVGQLFNVGDSILVVTRIFDDRALASLELFGLKFTGDSSLGTLTVTQRYTAVPAPAPGTSFPAGSTALRVRRFLFPATPVDTSVDSLVILAVVKDAAGNIDSIRKRVNVVTGPKVTIISPIQGDSVAANVAMRIQVRVTHQVGVLIDSVRVRGDTGFRGAARLDTLFVKTYTGNQSDVTLDTTVLIPASAPDRGRITVTAKAVDVNRNPGSTNPVTVTVRRNAQIPRVVQVVPPRFELDDSLRVTANGDGIAVIGVTVRDSAGTFLKRVTVNMPTPFTSNASANIVLNLSDTLQGRRINVSSFATDQAGINGYSIKPSFIGAQTDSNLAFNDTSLVVFGTTYALPHAGNIGDVAVDESRGHVFLSNLDNNRLELWRANSKTFYRPGIPVGSAPWGLARSATQTDSILLVGNSGGTNISQVFIGSTDTLQMAERLSRRFRTRIPALFEVLEVIDNGGKISITVKEPLLFSNRPQYVGQVNAVAPLTEGEIFFSTRTTTERPKGMIYHFNPSFPFPDLYSIVNYKPAPNVPNYLVLNADSVFVKPAAAGSGRPDTIVICDHDQNTNGASQCARAPQVPPGDVTSLGLGAAVAHLGTLPVPINTDIELIPRVDINSVGYTDTSFVATSGDRSWVAFGTANTQGAGVLFMSRANPKFFSPIFSQVDLTNNASEHIFGLALDSVGLDVAGHGSESYFASVDPPFHLRLQGKFATFQHGAGIAFHPGARGINTPVQERLAFVASDNKSIQVLDIAHYIEAGTIPLKHKLYGPLRVTRRFPTDPADVVLKLYGISLEGGLTILDVRDRDLKPTP